MSNSWFVYTNVSMAMHLAENHGIVGYWVIRLSFDLGSKGPQF